MDTKLIDRRLASEAGTYQVGFCVEETGLLEYPHAFVIWCKDDEFVSKGRCSTGAGFYPIDGVKKFEALLGVKGQLSDADAWAPISRVLLVRVNSDIFNLTDMVRQREMTAKGLIYQLFKSDCVDLLNRIAVLIPSLKLPTNAELPGNFVASLMNLNA